ncbi:energy-coupling factor transporter ATP-binding protein EcfA2 [Pseudomonas citronellolis]|uniref:ATP-dependent nuclease n=1 Tax=Pseudomonas citronellolis TaxID=53408 RepID=UPI00209DE3EE|nr:AAA family ATPase [Pseudomonas citronellolis]MCP1645621.1 energy-coupling factor transporter ATP-binding protein EcfA2 [Pseudomonas citronellolis]MCP1667507.1 energy-coupling factor transporter ATP-binding protein EcfA2 [Pseudomonas citronellolis]MCP1699893.1 energy-coupling factor transporter ATP-binding protein EcfA2 [Pseudomonas citronellolis]MCP1705335.1 energy-coupling factor transporter ATP-binding protein EcfA2 [Pseudomonas citronellolis]MCP1800075.1 energy-coupling factor transporte
MPVSITSLKFYNFKAYREYSISLSSSNILVGPNNSGKSTAISAFRILEAALRIARSRSPEFLQLTDRRVLGHKIPESIIPISLENVHTNYDEIDTRVEYRFSNGNRLFVDFPYDGGCILNWDAKGPLIKSPTSFKNAFPFAIQVVPVLGPFEHEEVIVTDDTVKRSLGTPRASRHFRNFWLKNQDGFDEFRLMLESTWAGMSIKRPEVSSLIDRKIAMFCSENRMDREVFWAGFGFQIWCQLLTHISRSSQFDLTVIDEPEVYLHPDLQRQLLGLLRDYAREFVLASHSTEIIGEADPSEIILIDKSKRSAKRVKDVEGVQQALHALGSIQNITLTQLARNKRVLFVEGLSDFKIIRRFAKKLGCDELAAGTDITAVESGGFSSWERVRSLAWGLTNTLGAEIKIAAVYDHDFWCAEQINETRAELERHLVFAHIHERKEMENYLLEPQILQRVIEGLVKEKEKRDGQVVNVEKTACEYLDEISTRYEDSFKGQYISKYCEYHKGSGKDQSTLVMEALGLFGKMWDDLNLRMVIVGGKAILKELRSICSESYGITLTDVRIIDGFNRSEIPKDLVELVNKLESYRSAQIDR